MSRTILVFRSSVRSHATHAIGKLKNCKSVYNYSTVLGAAIKCKPYSETTVESWTHLKTVKITMNLFEVYIGMNKSTGYLKSIFLMIINGLVFSCARGWTKRKITPGGVYKIITERIKEIKKSVPWLILVLCQITTLFGADYCSKVRLNSRLKAKTKVLIMKSCNGLFLVGIIWYQCLFSSF